jgi:hypothetical protein
MKKTKLASLSLCAALISLPATADMFDGSEPLMCALADLVECLPGGQCERVTAESINAPRFWRINFKEKQITTTRAAGKAQTSPIDRMESLDEKLFLQGVEDGLEGVKDGLGWSLAIAQESGQMVITASGGDVAFVAFGACTPL